MTPLNLDCRPLGETGTTNADPFESYVELDPGGLTFLDSSGLSARVSQMTGIRETS
ncbi:hypothetical protein [Nonomuraea sp. LPB2021202275-12-8]|uniref:hypothetical protein n=1 Tax=Nonomuraea sp. LPB2021202275-12-8 TaxID=3120159 RepID=UPI00300D3D56